MNVDETIDSVESMINTPSLELQKSIFKQPLKKKKKDDIGNLLQQSIANREKRAKERAMERKKLEDSKTPNDPLYHFFMSMYHTTQKLSPTSQYFIKNQVYKLVSEAEANLLNIPTTYQQTIHEQLQSTAAWRYKKTH